MEEPDFYDILQVPPKAGPEEIRRAYRALLRRHHPDLNGQSGAEGVPAHDTAAVLRAYQVLSDPERRALYDRRSRPAEEIPEPGGRRINVRVHRRDSGTGPRQPRQRQQDFRDDPVWIGPRQPRQRQQDYQDDPVWIGPVRSGSAGPRDSRPPEVFDRLFRFRFFR